MKNSLNTRHIVLLSSLYVSQAIGFGFFTEAFIGILRKSGMPLENLSLIYMLGLFMILRFLWAPVVDKVKFKKGHY